MKPALPKPRACYRVAPSKNAYADMLAEAPHAFLVWARIEGAPADVVILLRRTKTHEIPGSKWVEYRAEADGHLANGTPFTAPGGWADGTLDVVIGSDWAAYLKLVLRKKGAWPHERDGRLAILRRCGAVGAHGGFRRDQVWDLVAVDPSTPAQTSEGHANAGDANAGDATRLARQSSVPSMTPSILQSCFDAACDPTPAYVLPLTVNLKTGDTIGDRPVSKYFAETVLLYCLGYVYAMGFLPESALPSVRAERTPQAETGPLVVARWVDPITRTAYWAELHLQTRSFRTSASAGEACRGFGLVGLAAALVHPASRLRETWTALLVHTQTIPGLASLTPASVGPIALSIADALVGILPTTDPPGDGWHQIVAPLDYTPPSVDDLKDRLLTVDDFLDLLQYLACDDLTPARFQGPQLQILRGLIRRRKHTVLLGPPGTGKSVCAFEALALEQYAVKGVDYQIFMGHDDVKAADLLGAWQPTESAGLFRWVAGPLVRAMTAHGGKGQPILVEEFLRMPRRAQNIFITALSDGYLVLNEKPDDHGRGELIEAGPDFVFLADMNVDAAADDLELYGAAFASRVRKLVYGYPSEAVLLHILTETLPTTTPAIRAGLVATYTRVLARFELGDVVCPLSPRACLQWGEELAAALPSAALMADSSAVRTAAAAAAHTTWLTDVAGFTAANQQPLLDDIEAQFRKAFGLRPVTTPGGASRAV